MPYSYSSTSNFNTCPTYYKYDKIDRIQKCEPGAESNARAWGIAIHIGLQVAYSNPEISIEHVFSEFEKAYPESLDESDVVRSVEGGRLTLEAYVKRWAKVDQDNWEILHVERANDEFDASDLRIDIVAKQRSSGSIYFWDHKTVEKIPYDFERRYAIDGQLARYTLHVREQFGDCAGALINFICPAFRQRKWKDRPAGWDFRLERQLVIQTPQQLEFWKRSQEQWDKLIDWCKAENVWPAHLGWQCARCEFWEACYSAGNFEGLEGIYESKPERSTQ